MTECKECGKGVRSARSLRTGVCGDCREERERAQWRMTTKRAIRSLLARDDVLILDTETTGAGREAEVIEVSVIDTRGAVRLDTLVRPRVQRMNPYAERLHGISLETLQDAPTWPEVLPELARISERSTLLAWNAPFDASMLERTSEVWELHHPKWLFVCAMRLYAKGRGIRNRGLHKCVVDEGLEGLLEIHPSHRALGDVRFVLEVLRATVKAPAHPEHA